MILMRMAFSKYHEKSHKMIIGLKLSTTDLPTKSSDQNTHGIAAVRWELIMSF